MSDLPPKPMGIYNANDFRLNELKKEVYDTLNHEDDKDYEFSDQYDQIVHEIKMIIDGKEARLIATSLLDVMMDCAAQIMEQLSQENRHKFINENTKDIFRAFVVLEEKMNSNDK